MSRRIRNLQRVGQRLTIVFLLKDSEEQPATLAFTSSVNFTIYLKMDKAIFNECINPFISPLGVFFSLQFCYVLLIFFGIQKLYFSKTYSGHVPATFPEI